MSTDNMSVDELKRLLEGCRRRNEHIRFDTIEECARAIENAAINEANAGYYAKVIRAKKDKP